jgi:CheY-like chemotaxis protein
MLKETFPRSISIQTSLAPDLWVIIGDFTQIYQALLNLCVNARDAMPNGGRLGLEAYNIVIDEEAASRNRDVNTGSYVVLSVVDTGMGIPPQVIDKVFDPFFTTKEVNQGTGLGLSTVLGIVKNHGGFVTAVSTVGHGTRITAYLPAEQSSLAQDGTELAIAPPTGQGELILVVDDEAGVLEVTKATLQAHGYQVLTATDGAKAVDLYARHHRNISVVITDMMMPGMDGEAMSHVLRRMNPAVKVIAVSGLLEHTPKVGVGPIPFLPKPYTTDGLLNLLQQILRDGSPSSQR